MGSSCVAPQVADIGDETSELSHLLNIADEMTQAKSAILGGDIERGRDLLGDAHDDCKAYGTQDSTRLAEMKAALPAYFAWDKNVRDDVAVAAAFVGDRLPKATAPGQKVTVPPALLEKLDYGVVRIQSAVHECQGFMVQAQQAADRILQIGLILVGGLSALILSCAVLISQWHYQSVMRPLERLRQWVRRVGGAGDFPPPIEISGDLEFCELTVDVNQMAKELHDFYRELDQKVEQTSRELVRSQRLASVGFLAAGVAHEINNPLNIMSGYAELTLSRLARGFDPEAAADAQRALEVIREEAFRCKQITAKLLSTARGSGENRETFSLRHLSREVAAMLQGLPLMRDRQLDLKFDGDDPLEVSANYAELKQVLLNLLMNGLEAVNPPSGRVTLSGRRDKDFVELIVTDNGRGMEAATLERIFEPFFTEKRGVGEPGTGLGLCISHAIIENHGGKILAQSPGVDQGSTFTVRMPAAQREERSRLANVFPPAPLEAT